MQTNQGDPDRVQRIVFGLVVVYFAVWIAAIALDSPTLSLLSDAFFGVVAIAIAALLYTRAGEPGVGDGDTPLTAAAVLLGLGGLLELVWVLAVIASLPLGVADDLASLLVFAGLAAYVYAAWVTR